MAKKTDKNDDNFLSALLDDDEKESHTIYISKKAWKRLANWCSRQKPKQRPSRVIEKLILKALENEK